MFNRVRRMFRPPIIVIPDPLPVGGALNTDNDPQSRRQRVNLRLKLVDPGT